MVSSRNFSASTWLSVGLHPLQSNLVPVGRRRTATTNTKNSYINEATMNPFKGAVSHHDAEVVELRTDPELSTAYLKVASESLGDPDNHAAALLALQAVTEAGNLSRLPSARPQT
ncbi:hypothetical protein BO443_30486 [Burkholderia orbicola]